MKIIQGNLSLKKSVENREVKEPRARANRKNKQAARASLPEGSFSSETAQIMKQMILIQRSISKTQRILGGLEGFRHFLDSDKSLSVLEKELSNYISKITYDREIVLDPFRKQMLKILTKKDIASLDQLTGEAQRKIEELTGELGRYEIAEQNTRSLITQKDPLREILEGIKKEQDIPIHLKRENVLDLLT